MKPRWVAAIIAAVVIAFFGVFIWTGGKAPFPETIRGEEAVATVSDALSDGLIEAQIFALGDREVLLEIQFSPNADAPKTARMRPVVNFAMVDMHIDGINPPLELVAAGVWRVYLKLPRAGRWLVNIGMGEDFAEAEFDA